MKRYILIMVFIVFLNLQAQQKTQDYERVYIEAGLVQPLGSLSNKFDASPSFGFWFRNRIEHQDFVDFGFNFFIPRHARNVDFKIQDSNLSYKSKHFAINIGARFAKVMPLSLKSDHFHLEWNSGIGLALNVYKAPEDFVFEEGINTGEILTTFLLSQGIKINYKNLGLQCHYQYTPYELFEKKVESNFGSQSIMFGIVYRQ